MSRIRDIGLVTSRLSQNRSPKKKGMVSQIESKFITSETGPKAQPSFTEYPTHCFFFYFWFVRKLAGLCIDSFSYNVGAPFSTKDRDADIYASRNCAVDHQGAWWYKLCTECNLNGKYNPLAGQEITGIYWYRINDKPVRLKWVEIKIQPFG